VLKAINFDLKNTVFSYIPNTAETAFYGMMAGIEDYLITKQKEIIVDGKPSVDTFDDILSFRPDRKDCNQRCEASYVYHR